MKKRVIELLLLCTIPLLLSSCKEKETVVEPQEYVMGEESKKDENEDAPKVEKVTSTTIEKKRLAPDISREKDLKVKETLDSMEASLEKGQVLQNPYGNSPLTAYILFRTEAETKVRVTIKGKKKAADLTKNVSAAKKHRIPVVGLYPDYKNKVIVEVMDADGKVIEKKNFTIQTEALPSSLKNAVKVEKHTKKSAYPLTIVSGQKTAYPFAYDEEGEIRWFVKKKTSNYGVFPLSNTHFMLQGEDSFVTTEEKPHTTEMHEMDYMGRVYAVYYTKKGYHHEVIEKEPDGNLLILTSSIKGHVEDVVQELDRKTGKIVKSVDMQQLVGDKYVDMIDWCHLNTASYKAEDHSVLLSPRNIHSGIKMDWKTDKVKWILGNPQFWEGTEDAKKVLKPEGNIKWHYQPHSIYEIPYDLDKNPDTVHVMVYDNHWNTQRKVSFFDGDKNSYVSVYVVNEKKMTVKQVRLFESVKSKITSNCAYDKEKNRMFSFGGYLDPLIEGRQGMIYEHDYDSERVLNQYSFRYYFYRGYEMNYDLDSMTEELNQEESYVKGTLLAPRETEAKEVPKEKAEKKMADFVLKETALYMKTKDHSVMKVRFIGKNKTYVVDYSDAAGGEAKYKNTAYSIAIPAGGLKPDMYQIAICYQDDWYDTGKEIKVNE